MNAPCNVLLSSVGRRAYLVRYFQQALGGYGLVIATNCISETTGMLAADISEVVPSGQDPAFIDALLDVCQRHKIKLLCYFLIIVHLIEYTKI